MSIILSVLWRSAFQARRLRHAYPSTSCPVSVAALRSAFQAPSRKNELGRPFRTALSIYSNRKQTIPVYHSLLRAWFILSAWKALQSETMVTGHAVSGTTRTVRCAWKALRQRTGFKESTAIYKFCSRYPNRKQTLSPFHALRRALFFRLQFLRFCFLGNFESLGKYNALGLAKIFQAEKKNGLVSSFQLSYKPARTIL